MSCFKRMAEVNSDVLKKFMKDVPEPLTANEYQKLAMRTCNISQENGEMIVHGVLGLNSEAGEVIGHFQKFYQGHEIDSEKVLKEVGDCLWMIAEICTGYGVTLESVMRKNIEKLKARYPDGFDPEKSLHRAPGDD